MDGLLHLTQRHHSARVDAWITRAEDQNGDLRVVEFTSGSGATTIATTSGSGGCLISCAAWGATNDLLNDLKCCSRKKNAGQVTHSNAGVTFFISCSFFNLFYSWNHNLPWFLGWPVNVHHVHHVHHLGGFTNLVSGMLAVYFAGQSSASTAPAGDWDGIGLWLVTKLVSFLPLNNKEDMEATYTVSRRFMTVPSIPISISVFLVMSCRVLKQVWAKVWATIIPTYPNKMLNNATWHGWYVYMSPKMVSSHVERLGWIFDALMSSYICMFLPGLHVLFHGSHVSPIGSMVLEYLPTKLGHWWGKCS